MKKYLVAGLLVWLPLAITIWVLSWLLGALDGVFAFLLSATQAVLPESARAGVETLRHVPGLGVLVMLGSLLLTGVFAANIFGQWWLRQADRVLSRTPIVKSIYNSVKQVSDTLFSSNGNAFREAVKAATGGKGPDVIYDPVGGDFAEPAFRSIAWRGRYLIGI